MRNVLLKAAFEKRAASSRERSRFSAKKVFFLGFFASFLILFSSSLLWAAGGICKPGIVRLDGRFIPASMKGRGADVQKPKAVRLRFLGHSSFLISAPGGGRAVMDPYVVPVLNPPPEAITVSNFHETHSITGPYDGKSEIFFGVTNEGKANPIDRTFGNLRIASFPQVDGSGKFSIVLNTIYVFQAGGICVAHFGNARFGPSPGQIQALGKIHVLLLPIDGSFTVPHEVAVKIVKRIGPNIVIPMHYFGPELPGQFAEALKKEGITRVLRPAKPDLAMTRRRLPPPTTYVVLPDVNVP